MLHSGCLAEIKRQVIYGEAAWFCLLKKGQGHFYMLDFSKLKQ